jgi:hypothetical protein
MNLLVLTMALLYPDVHIPTATVSGDVVTVNADFAYLDLPDSGVSVGIVQGVQLVGDPAILSSTDGKLPVVWRLPPGTYSITAFGYPDNRLLPNRNKVILTVTVENPTRQQQIADALQRFSVANVEAEMAREEIKTLKPTRAEISAALVP